MRKHLVRIPFNKPYMTGRELDLIAQAHHEGHLAGDGSFTRECSQWLEQRTGASSALLTHSCTAALEITALLLEMEPGDEVIMPSYTFVSTANAFVLRGATPVFVDIRPDTLNIDETLIEDAITSRTRAICVVHYAGVAAEMDPIMEIAARHGLTVVEDAAQAILSTYKGRPLGTIGDFGTLSFHETKNIICGEGGALLCRDPDRVETAEIIREKGTNRSQFFRGQVDKYTWVGTGSSYLPAEVTAAFLRAQMDSADSITERRLALWDRYHTWAEDHENVAALTRPTIPADCAHNAHMYYILLPSPEERGLFLKALGEDGIGAVFHYVPLHSSPEGRRVGRVSGSMANTTDISERIVRLPLWIGLEDSLDYVLESADRALDSCRQLASVAR